MRRSNLLGAAALGAVVAVLALVAMPGVGVGTPTTSHGATPSDVFSTTEPDICAVVDVDGISTLPTSVTVDATSDLVASFSAERSGITGDNELLVTVDIFSNEAFVEGTPFEWGFGRTFKTHESGTVQWTFDNVPTGTYIVQAGARMDPAPPGPGGTGTPTSVMENCALTVFVTPVVQ
jgi:hypothetical protein